MIHRLRPLRHVLPLAALAFAVLALFLPPFFTDEAGLSLFADPLAVACALVGWLLTTRRPQNPIGWLFAAWGFGAAFATFAAQYTVYGGFAHPGALPLVPWVAWLGTILWHPGFGMYVLILLLFPTGKPMTRSWRWATWFAIAWYTALGLTVTLFPQFVLPDWYPHLDPPFQGPGGQLGQHLYDVLLFGNLFVIFAALATQVLRYRRSAEAERYQIKWFVWPTVAALLVVLASFWVFDDGRMFPVMLPVIPIAAAVAVLRYRLYDIDRVVSRSVAWLLLTIVVVGVYIGVVAAATALLPESSGVGVAAATLAAAAVFEPARRRLQSAVDRQFNRQRYDAARLVDAFAGHLRDEVELPKVEAQLLDVAVDAVQPATISLWRIPVV